MPMIPDWATIRDTSTGLRKKIYGILALGWQGTPKQWHRIETAMQIMSIVIVPVAVSRMLGERRSNSSIVTIPGLM